MEFQIVKFTQKIQMDQIRNVNNVMIRDILKMDNVLKIKVLIVKYLLLKQYVKHVIVDLL